MRATRIKREDHSNSINRSWASMFMPTVAGTDLILPSRSARSSVSIFMASIASSASPCSMRWPFFTLTLTTRPGIGAATCLGLSASAFGWLLTSCARLRSVMSTVRGWPLSSKKTRHRPLLSASLMPSKRIISRLPRSSWISISSCGLSPWKKTGVGNTLISP